MVEYQRANFCTFSTGVYTKMTDLFDPNTYQRQLSRLVPELCDKEVLHEQVSGMRRRNRHHLVQVKDPERRILGESYTISKMYSSDTMEEAMGAMDAVSGKRPDMEMAVVDDEMLRALGLDPEMNEWDAEGGDEDPLADIDGTERMHAAEDPVVAALEDQLEEGFGDIGRGKRAIGSNADSFVSGVAGDIQNSWQQGRSFKSQGLNTQRSEAGRVFPPLDSTMEKQPEVAVKNMGKTPQFGNKPLNGDEEVLAFEEKTEMADDKNLYENFGEDIGAFKWNVDFDEERQRLFICESASAPAKTYKLSPKLASALMKRSTELGDVYQRVADDIIDGNAVSHDTLRELTWNLSKATRADGSKDVTAHRLANSLNKMRTNSDASSTMGDTGAAPNAGTNAANMTATPTTGSTLPGAKPVPGRTAPAAMTAAPASSMGATPSATSAPSATASIGGGGAMMEEAGINECGGGRNYSKSFTNLRESFQGIGLLGETADIDDAKLNALTEAFAKRLGRPLTESDLMSFYSQLMLNESHAKKIGLLR